MSDRSQATPPPRRVPPAVTIIKLAWCVLLASVVAAGLMFPVVGGFGLMSNRASDVVANGSAQLVEGEVPAVSTMVDAKGNPLAWLYSQRPGPPTPVVAPPSSSST
jgi:membrane peptidoglycan carboxypeptidase